MERQWKVLVTAGVLLSLFSGGSAFRCERESLWGTTQIFNCPEPGNDPNELFCCGFGDNKYCCSTPTEEEIIEQFFDKDLSEPMPQPLAQVQAGQSTQQRGTLTAAKDKAKTAVSGRVASIKDKVKAKINSTISHAKDKVKQKVKDKVKEKANQKLDPTKGHLPTILGVIVAIILIIIVLCIVCCCCCPFCLLYKRRNQGTVHNPNPEVSVMQPLQSQHQAYPPQQQAPYPAQPVPVHPPPTGYPPQPYPQGPYPQAPYPTDQPPMYTEKQPPPYNPTY